MDKINEKLVFVSFNCPAHMEILSANGWSGGMMDFEKNGQYFYKD